jgi:hypothetical protein
VRERLAFTTAVAVIAVHAAVDAFFAPEPGTAWDDHLPRGTVTLAVLAAALLLYPRLRAGARAAVAAVLGVLSLEGALLAVYDARAIGARGEDWSGFFLAPAGLFLCGIAVVLLWSSRKPGRLRYLRRAGLGLATLLGAFWIVVPLAVAIGATHRPRAAVKPAELGRAYEPVTLRTRDGLELAAWYVPSRNGAAVISFPTRKGKLPQARMLVRHGYGVLLLDARGYDGSEGDPNVFGWGTGKDIDASVGGEMMLEAAASNTALRAVVSEGAGARSFREDLLRGPRDWFALPAQAMQTAALAVMSGTAPPDSLDHLVAKIAPRPLLLIYAGRSAAGEDLNVDYFRAAGKPKALWKIAQAGHVGGYQAAPREYERRVIAFFDRALLRAPKEREAAKGGI